MGNTALHVAVDISDSLSDGHKEIVESLLGCPRFTERDAKNNQKKTAEMIVRASKKKSPHLLNLFGKCADSDSVPKIRKK